MAKLSEDDMAEAWKIAKNKVDNLPNPYNPISVRDLESGLNFWIMPYVFEVWYEEMSERYGQDE